MDGIGKDSPDLCTAALSSAVPVRSLNKTGTENKLQHGLRRVFGERV